MLVKQFKFKRNSDKGGFRWTAESAIETPGSYRGFTAVGKTLADVKEFAALVRWCERTGVLERIGNGMEAEKRKQQEFFDLAERFRSATDPEEVKRLGDRMGRMVFGD